MSAESASLKIGYTSLKVRNLPFCASCVYDANPQNGFKQTDFLRFVPPIFLTLTSQGGNQGILRSASYLFKRSQKSVFAEISDRLRLICLFCGICLSLPVIPQNRTNRRRNEPCEFVYAESPHKTKRTIYSKTYDI